ncbi:hypothetical protein LCGC14_0176160 [marine sediment metagenome]|uniref:Uncharacterized protein n=1 Tax=marine sediment metagenome TaxID=412755 RepID=A0A0F9V7P8_9ZZZZ
MNSVPKQMIKTPDHYHLEFISISKGTAQYRHIYSKGHLVLCDILDCDNEEWFDENKWYLGINPLKDVDLLQVCNCCGEIRDIHRGVDKTLCRKCWGIFH